MLKALVWDDWFKNKINLNIGLTQDFIVQM